MKKYIIAGAMTLGILLASAPTFGNNAGNSAQNGTSTSAAVLTCMQNAVDVRDTSLLTAFDTYYASVKSALQARRAALMAAWAIQSKQERRAAITTAWNIYKTAWKNAQRALNTARNAAWHKFQDDKTACRPGSEAGMDRRGAWL